MRIQQRLEATTSFWALGVSDTELRSVTIDVVIELHPTRKIIPARAISFEDELRPRRAVISSRKC